MYNNCAPVRLDGMGQVGLDIPDIPDIPDILQVNEFLIQQERPLAGMAGRHDRKDRHDRKVRYGGPDAPAPNLRTSAASPQPALISHDGTAVFELYWIVL